MNETLIPTTRRSGRTSFRRLAVAAVAAVAVVVPLAAAAPAGAAPSRASHCWVVEGTYKRRSLLHLTTMYVMHQRVQWCAAGSRVTSVTRNAWFTDMSHLMQTSVQPSPEPTYTGGGTAAAISTVIGLAHNDASAFGIPAGSDHPWISIKMTAAGQYSVASDHG